MSLPFSVCKGDCEKDSDCDGDDTFCNQCDGDPTCVKICPTEALRYINTDRVNIGLKREKAHRLMEVNKLLEVNNLKDK